jgi:prepilin-type N-terminal cleavage/methylation domain-containing protein
MLVVGHPDRQNEINMHRSGRRGFTLVELLVVMVMIAILAAIAIPRFTRTREAAFRSTMIADLKNLSSHQDLYLVANATYGSDLASLGANVSKGVTLDVTEATATGWAATAVHAALVGSQCGVFYGSAAAANGAPALSPGVITCDVVP